MKRVMIYGIVLSGFMFFARTLSAVNPTAGEQIKWSVISGGGGDAASGSYKLSHTVGQTTVGTGTSAGYKLINGFWQNFSPTLGPISGGCPSSWTINRAMTPITYTVTGGTAPYTWDLSAGVLPTGVSFIPATHVLTGTPTTAGVFNFTVRVTDATASSQTQPCSWVINPALGAISGVCPPEWTINRAMTPITYTVIGGTTPYTWDVSAGAIPTGVSLSSGGVLSGTPSVAGLFSFTVRVTDAAGATQTKPCSWVVNSALGAIAGECPPTWTLNTAITPITYTVTGGTAPRLWDISVGALPTGVVLAPASGILSGTPTIVGIFNFTVRVTEAAGSNQTKACSWTIQAGCCAGTTGNVNMIGIVDLTDLSSLVSYLAGGGFVLPCQPEANINNAGIVDLSDLSSLVSYLTGGGFVLPNCP